MEFLTEADTHLVALLKVNMYVTFDVEKFEAAKRRLT
jgi:hypothetical protein